VFTAEGQVSGREANALFAGLETAPGLLLAVSGGPDSTALLMLAARWVKRLKRPPRLIAVTVDHGLRAESAREATTVKRLSARFGVPHRTLRWSGAKPRTGLQQAARIARYRLLAEAAVRVGFAHIVTAHTLDDQAETVLLRLARGSGLTGLAAMARGTPLFGERSILLVRPLLGIPKARLLATLAAAKIAFADDASNRDPRFTRARLRTILPALAREGLDARRLSLLAWRVRRAEAAIEFAVHAARLALSPGPWEPQGPVAFDSERFATLPAEVGLRLLGRAIGHTGDEGPVELAKLEALYAALHDASGRLRRTLAGALITLTQDRLTIERAPRRRALTKHHQGQQGLYQGPVE
jgi:tRNA(Ile)-lysidine synthase